MGTSFRLSALSPFGPIFAKELRTTARRKRTYALRFFYLLVLLLVLLTVWSNTSYRREHQSTSVAERAQNDARLGEEFFLAFSMFSITALAAISPILTATAVNAERQAKTLPVLLMTPITSWQIVSGKLFSRLLAALTLIGLSLPVLAVVRLLGSLEIEQMVGVVSLCVATSLAGAAIGLFYSTFMNRAYAVILMSYATMLVLYAFVPFVMALSYKSNGGPPGQWFFDILLASNPFFSTVSIVESRSFGRMIGPQFLPCVAAHCVLTGLLVFLSAVMIRRIARREGEGGAGAAPLPDPVAPPPLSERGVSTLPALPSLSPASGVASLEYASPRDPRSISDNPVLWRELRRPLMAKRAHAIIGGVVVVGMLLLTYALIAYNGGRGPNNPLSDPDLQIGYASIFWALLALLTCVLSATTIAGEKESDTWTLLLASPLDGRAIVLGKLAGIYRRLLWPGVLILAHFILFTVCGVLSFASFCLICWIMLAFNTVWVATGLYFSLKVRKVTLAVILNLLVPMAAYLFVFALLEIAGNVLFERRDSYLSEFVEWYLPFFYLDKVVNHLSDRFARGGYVPRSEISMPMNWGPASLTNFVAITFAVGAAYFALAAAIVGHTIRKFDRIVGRASSK